MQSEHSRLQSGGDDRLHQRLTRLEVFAADRQFILIGESHERGNINGEVRRAIGKWDSGF